MNKSIADTINEVEAYQNLKEGWDGIGSTGPMPDDVEQAVKLLNFWPNTLPVPIPMINYEGKIGFYIDNTEYYMDLEIEQDNKLSLYIRSRLDKTKELFTDTVVIDSNVGHEIHRYTLEINTDHHLFTQAAHNEHKLFG